MLAWCITFLILALITAIFSLSGFTSFLLSEPEILPGIFIILSLVTLVAHKLTARKPPLS